MVRLVYLHCDSNRSDKFRVFYRGRQYIRFERFVIDATNSLSWRATRGHRRFRLGGFPRICSSSITSTLTVIKPVILHPRECTVDGSLEHFQEHTRDSVMILAICRNLNIATSSRRCEPAVSQTNLACNDCTWISVNFVNLGQVPFIWPREI